MTFMNIPTKKQCDLLLAKYNFPDRKRKHVEMVTKAAVFLVGKINEKTKKQKNAIAQNCYHKENSQINERLNIDLVYAGGILHDIDKGITGAGEAHPQKGVEILMAEGYPKVARICETHTINAFLDSKTIPTTWEEKCVALADKMVKNEVIGVEERFRLWREEDLPEKQKEVLQKSYPLVKEMEREVLEIIGMGPEDIKFLISNQ